MTMFLDKELSAVESSRQHYDIARRRARFSTKRLKLQARLLIASPGALLAFFGIGAYKGATTDSPPSRRRQALVTFARTALVKFIS